MSIKGLAWGHYRIQLEYSYSPAVRSFESSQGGLRLINRLNRDLKSIRKSLEKIRKFTRELGAISAEAPLEAPDQPCWNNGWMTGLDAAMLYTLVADRKPKVYLEIGSGISTKFVRRAIRDHNLSTRLISVDPAPRTEVDAICDLTIRKSIEMVDIADLTSQLSPGDVIFIDSSHRGFQNSDVTVCFLELMPDLPVGSIFGVHDICLPYDYDPCYLDYFYNEQYYLAMYLLGGSNEDRIILPSYFVSRDPALEPLARAAQSSIPESVRGGSAFWLEMGAGSRRQRFRSMLQSLSVRFGSSTGRVGS